MGRRPGKNFVAPGLRARKLWKTTHYYYDAGGKPRKEIPLGTDFAAALKKWAELRGEGHEKVGETLTLAYVIQRYVREVSTQKSPATLRDHKRESANLLRFFNDPPAVLSDIQPIHVRQYMDWRHSDSKAGAAAKNAARRKAGRDEVPLTGKEGRVRSNREKALLSAVWNQAREWGYTDRTNPCSGVSGFEETGRDIYIEDDVFRRVYEAGDQPLRDAMDLAYLTGQRVADTLLMSERDIRDGALHVKQGKTSAKLRIGVDGELAMVIERIRARKQALSVVAMSLIVTEDGGAITKYMLRRRFDLAREKAGIEKALFQFRDLRAKAGTDKADSSGDIRQAQRQLGHMNLSMTEHYVRKRKGEKVGPTK